MASFPALKNHIGGPEAFYLGQLIVSDTATKLKGAGVECFIWSKHIQ